jgi:hypothetical protein
MNIEEPIVWHEPILDESWNQLEAAIDRYRQLKMGTDISCIHIENVEIKKECLAALIVMFFSGRATNSSMQINFYNTNLCGEGIVCLSELVAVSPQLQVFRLYHNRIDSMNSARCLSASLRNHDHISWFYLNHCDLGSNPDILSIILQSDVSHINLRHNNIDSLGAVKIAEYLESDPPIHSIDLDYNRLNDDDAVLISQALKRNTNLQEIRLDTNHFTSMGVKALLTCFFDNSSLNAISKSNHTLERMMFFNYSRDDSWLQDCIDRLLALNRTQKIMLALQDKDSLLQYLANIPLGLIPEVLAFPL